MSKRGHRRAILLHRARRERCSSPARAWRGGFCSKYTSRKTEVFWCLCPRSTGSNPVKLPACSAMMIYELLQFADMPASPFCWIFLSGVDRWLSSRAKDMSRAWDPEGSRPQRVQREVA